jgi:L-asparaginase II
MTSPNPYQPLVEATRGSLVESVHCGAFAVVDSRGNLIASCGDVQHITYMRSSSKPLQVLSMVEDGGMEKFGFDEEELSLMCASHAGTDHHVAVVSSIQKKAGLQESDLQCGIQPPADSATRKAMLLRDEKPTPRRHECSGKHSGMLSNALLHHFSTDDYLNPDHPVQKLILKTCAELWNLRPEDVPIGIDGCSAPVFAVPLYNAALAFARLSDPVLLSLERARACRRIFAAMASFPEMVAGPGAFDTRLMEVGKGKIITKTGAEGFQSVAVLPGVTGPNSAGIGIAIKIADGDPPDRARSVITIEILRRMGVLSEQQIAELPGFAKRPLYNWRGLEVGELRPCFP